MDEYSGPTRPGTSRHLSKAARWREAHATCAPPNWHHKRQHCSMVLAAALGGRALPATRVIEQQFAGAKRLRLPRGGRLFCQAKLPDCKIMGEGAKGRSSAKQALQDLKKPLGEHLLKSNCMPIIIRLAWHDAGTYDKVGSPCCGVQPIVAAGGWPDLFVRSVHPSVAAAQLPKPIR